MIIAHHVQDDVVEAGTVNHLEAVARSKVEEGYQVLVHVDISQGKFPAA
jgi:hypothetical protein